MNKSTAIAIVLFAILSVGGNVFLGIKFFTAPQINGAPDITQQTLTAVGKIMELPTDETPTIATVDDPKQLIDQGVFSKVQKGDTVLIYKNAKRAILYRPSTNKIIEVATVNITDAPPATAPKPTAAPTPAPAPAPTPAPTTAPAPVTP